MADSNQSTLDELQAWLDQVQEEPLQPLFPIIDAHHHLWDKPKYEPGIVLAPDVAAMFGARSARGGSYLVDDFLHDIQGNNIVKSVYIENSGAFYDKTLEPHLQQVGEVRYCQQICDMTQDNAVHLCAGVVGNVNFFMGDSLDAVLQALVEAAPTALKGVRHQTMYDDDPMVFTRSSRGALLDPTFQLGFRQLSKYGLSADVVVVHQQLPEVKALACTFPDIPIALDHVGIPLGVGSYAGNRSAVYETWKANIHDLAQCPNVYCKLSGLTMPVCGFGWERQSRPPDSLTLSQQLTPYIEYCLQEFGPSRCMFASNFPVDKASCSYTVLWNAFKRITTDLPIEDQQAIFHNTANQFYRL